MYLLRQKRSRSVASAAHLVQQYEKVWFPLPTIINKIIVGIYSDKNKKRKQSQYRGKRSYCKLVHVTEYGIDVDIVSCN